MARESRAALELAKSLGTIAGWRFAGRRRRKLTSRARCLGAGSGVGRRWIGLSRRGSLDNFASSYITCMWSGTIGIGPAQGNGLASVIVARVLRGGKISGLIAVVVWISGGTIRFRCFRSPSSSPTCLLSGTIGIVPARGNGSASAIRAVMPHDDKSPSLICNFIHLLGGTVHFSCFKWLRPFSLQQDCWPNLSKQRSVDTCNVVCNVLCCNFED